MIDKRPPGTTFPTITCPYCGKVVTPYNDRQYTCGSYECKQQRRLAASQKQWKARKKHLSLLRR